MLNREGSRIKKDDDKKLTQKEDKEYDVYTCKSSHTLNRSRLGMNDLAIANIFDKRAGIFSLNP